MVFLQAKDGDYGARILQSAELLPTDLSEAGCMYACDISELHGDQPLINEPAIAVVSTWRLWYQKVHEAGLAFFQNPVWEKLLGTDGSLRLLMLLHQKQESISHALGQLEQAARAIETPGGHERWYSAEISFRIEVRRINLNYLEERRIAGSGTTASDYLTAMEQAYKEYLSDDR